MSIDLLMGIYAIGALAACACIVGEAWTDSGWPLIAAVVAAVVACVAGLLVPITGAQ